MSTKTNILTIGGTALFAGVVGFLVAATMGGPPGVPGTGEGAPRPAGAAPVVVNAPRGLTADDVREIMRAELQNLRDVAPLSAAHEAAPPEEPSPEVVQARAASHESARSLVADALARGIWTQADAHALGDLIPQMDETQQRAIMAALFGAVNRRQVQPEVPGLMF